MNAISKPHLVDLLRIFDKKRYITPRIRYASVRSKPELIRDIGRHFKTEKVGSVVTLRPVHSLREIPLIQYDLKANIRLMGRRWMFRESLARRFVFRFRGFL